MQHDDAPGWQGRQEPPKAQPQDGRLPYEAVRQWYWPLNTTGGRDGRLVQAAIQAWINEREKPLWERLRDKSASRYCKPRAQIEQEIRQRQERWLIAAGADML